MTPQPLPLDPPPAGEDPRLDGVLAAIRELVGASADRRAGCGQILRQIEDLSPGAIEALYGGLVLDRLPVGVRH